MTTRTAQSEEVSRVLAGGAGDPLVARLDRPPLPSMTEARQLLGMVRSLLAPGFFEHAPSGEQEHRAWVEERLARLRSLLVDMACRAFVWAADRGVPVGQTFSGSPQQNAERTAEHALAQLPELRRLLALDIQAAYDGDPAARHTDETALCYPGVEAIATHRFAHALFRAGVPLLPRLLAETCHRDTAIDIHPGAQIGESFFIDHGTGVVIGETTEIGDHVKLYQGVTLGNRNFPKDEYGKAMRGLKRHPTIGDRVTIYANAVVLGGQTVVGDDCVISAGAVVAESIPPGQLVQQPRSELVLRPNRELRDR